jgi:hypothetical protein
MASARKTVGTAATAQPGVFPDSGAGLRPGSKLETQRKDRELPHPRRSFAFTIMVASLCA